MNTAKTLLLVCITLWCSQSVGSAETILFESGTLGATGISGTDVFNQIVAGGNLNAASFAGARFQIDTQVIVSSIGGHFVTAPNSPSDTFFGALIHLDESGDFPDSANLSTSDVIASTAFSVPQTSANVSTDLNAILEPGQYAVIFGSGQFGATGSGAVLRNNTPHNSPDHIGYGVGFGWGLRPDDMYFEVRGTPVPEPSTLALAVCTLTAFVVAR